MIGFFCGTLMMIAFLEFFCKAKAVFDIRRFATSVDEQFCFNCVFKRRFAEWC